MKYRRFPIIALLAGFLMMTGGLLAPYFYLLLSPGQGSDIIGGADLPMYRFIMFTVMDGWPFCLLLFGISLTIMSLVWLLFFKTVHGHCRWDTTFLSLGLSATGGLGLTCFLHWMTIVTFHEASKHPLLYPASIVTGLVCFAAFVALGGWYFLRRKNRWSVKGVVSDALTAILYLPAFFFASCYLIEWASWLIH